MDKLSFASVYRTAAILAAFSQASASGEEPVRAVPERENTEAPCRPVVLAAEMIRAFPAVVAATRQRLKIAARPNGDSGPCAGTAQSRRDMTDATPRAAPGRRLVSHFAFCDPSHPSGPSAEP